MGTKLKSDFESVHAVLVFWRKK